MRDVYLTAARALQLGREGTVEGDLERSLSFYQEALDLMQVLPPERTRNVLLAHIHLAFYQTLMLGGHPQPPRPKTHQRGKFNPSTTTIDREQLQREHLQKGVSYARSTRDPLARAIAEECLSPNLFQQPRKS